MLTVVLWCLLGLAVLGASGLLLWGLHRFCIHLEDRGYLYYRQSPQGGGASGVLQELDRLTRPSVEHVLEAQDLATKKEDEGVGGE